MSAGSAGGLTVFVLATIVGLQVIRRVPAALHTPLMSGANAISGITLLGAIGAASVGSGVAQQVLGVIAVAAATANVVGGFAVTDRMLDLFRRSRRPEPPDRG